MSQECLGLDDVTGYPEYRDPVYSLKDQAMLCHATLRKLLCKVGDDPPHPQSHLHNVDDHPLLPNLPTDLVLYYEATIPII